MDWKLKLIEKRVEAEGTQTFAFEKPLDFAYKPGDFFYFLLDELKYPDSRGKMRHFTLSSSPTENYLSFTCRMREQSGYKKTFNDLALGTLVKARGPEGIFDFPEKDGDTPEIMIAGGIGITPYRSRLRYIVDKNLNIPIHLLFANSTPGQITFKNELDEITKNHPQIKVTYFVSNPDNDWKGEVGRIDATKIKLATGTWNPATVIFWVCGPPAMVSGMEKVLESLGIDSKNIRTEKFTGY